MHVRYMTTASRTSSNKKQNQLSIAINSRAARPIDIGMIKIEIHTRMGLTSRPRICGNTVYLLQKWSPNLLHLGVAAKRAMPETMLYLDSNPKQYKIFSFLLDSRRFTSMYHGKTKTFISYNEKKSNCYVTKNPIIILEYPIDRPNVVIFWPEKKLQILVRHANWNDSRSRFILFRVQTVASRCSRRMVEFCWRREAQFIRFHRVKGHARFLIRRRECTIALHVSLFHSLFNSLIP